MQALYQRRPPPAPGPITCQESCLSPPHDQSMLRCVAGEHSAVALRYPMRQSRAVEMDQDASETSMPEWPRGTVTFLCTDIEGSTALWEREMENVVERHLALIRLLEHRITRVP